MFLSLKRLRRRTSFAQDMRLPGRDDDDALRCEGQPWTVAHADSPGTLEDVVDRDRLEAGISETPALLDFADGKGMQPHGQCGQKPIEGVHCHPGIRRYTEPCRKVRV